MEVVLGKDREQIIVDSINACERGWTTDKQNIFHPRKVLSPRMVDKEIGLLENGDMDNWILVARNLCAECVLFDAVLGSGKLWQQE